MGYISHLHPRRIFCPPFAVFRCRDTVRASAAEGGEVEEGDEGEVEDVHCLLAGWFGFSGTG